MLTTLVRMFERFALKTNLGEKNGMVYPPDFIWVHHVEAE